MMGWLKACRCLSLQGSNISSAKGLYRIHPWACFFGLFGVTLPQKWPKQYLKLWIFNRKYQQHVGKCPDALCMDSFPTLGEKRARSRGNVGKYFLYGRSEIWHTRNSKSFGVRILNFGAYVTHGMIRLFLYGGVHQWLLYLRRILINGGWNIFTDPWNFQPLRFVHVHQLETRFSQPQVPEVLLRMI